MPTLLQTTPFSADYESVDPSRALPTGVVTFLLTDIEGSTRLWEAEPDVMREALARHDAIVHTCVKRMSGHVVKSKGEGDSVFAVFRRGRDALTAALVLQCAFDAEDWVTSTPIRVRMAVHTGPIELRDGDYYGPTVNRCARLRALARGGQVLVSGVTAKLLAAQLPKGAILKDLGTHQLKDINAPERVWQLLHPMMRTGAGAPAEQPTGAGGEQLIIAYKLTDHLNRSLDGREWAERRTYRASGISPDDQDRTISCYATPSTAALLNPINEAFRLPRLWEAIVDRLPEPGEPIVDCHEVTTTRQVPIPAVTGKQHAAFAVLCAREAAHGGDYEAEFTNWAACWLAGQDSSGVDARSLADMLANEAHRGTSMAAPLEQMLADAARAASHASKLSFLVGRARDEENSWAIQYAGKAVRTAMRLARLDVVALAEQASPRMTAVPLTPLRTPPVVTPNRILRALPT